MAQEIPQELDKDERKFWKTYVSFLHSRSDLLIRRIQSTQKLLISMVEHPNARNIFSNDEIISINRTHRAIPELVEEIKRFKQSIQTDELNRLFSGEVGKHFNTFEGLLREVTLFAQQKSEKIPPSDSLLVSFILVNYITISQWLESRITDIQRKRMENRIIKMLAKKLQRINAV
jgi:hypothetical protein